MKKTIFTACSIAILCCAIIMACSKDDNNSITHVGYAVQMGTGHNPNPNQTPATTAYGTTTSTTATNTTSGTTAGTTTSTTTTPTSYGSITPSTGATVTFTSGPTCGLVTWTGSDGSTNSITFTFVGSAPSLGTYTIVPSNPTGSEVTVSYNGTAAQSGTVTVSATGTGTSYTASFTSANFGAFTASGSLICH